MIKNETAEQYDSMMSGIKDGSLSLAEGDDPAEQSDDGAFDSQPEDMESVPDPLDFLDGKDPTPNGKDEKSAQSVGKNKQEPQTGLKSNLETVIVGSKKTGSQKEVKVDFADKDKLKRYVQLAHQGNSWKAERDTVRQELEKIKTEHSQLAGDWEKLESIYKSKGVRGLVEQLEGQGGWDRFLDNSISERDRYQMMDPEERSRLQIAEQQAQSQSREKQIQEQYQKELEQLRSERESARVSEIQGKAQAAMSRYGFEGKLGNPDTENFYDDMIWDRTMKQLDKLETENPSQALTAAVIDREFKNQSLALRKHLKLSVQNQTKTAIDHAKKTAVSQAQATVRQGRPVGQANQQFANDVKNNNMVDALRSVLTGQVKL